jgi:hypothetical protein
MKIRIGGIALALVCAFAGLLAPAAGAAGGNILIGSQSIPGSADSNPAGLAQAFVYTASSSGTTSDMEIYVGSGTTATRVYLGVYSNSAGEPGSLLTSGSISNPTAGAWNDVSVGPTSISSGTTYWLALLGTGGTLAYQDTQGGGGGESYVSSSRSLTSFPAVYSSGHEWAASPASIYVNAGSPPSNTALPAISGQDVQGQTLTATTGSWMNSPTSYSYVWQHCSSSCSTIAGATQSSYTLQASDVGDTVDVVVTATNANGSGSATSAQTSKVTAPLPSPPTSTAFPVISGVAQEGQTLTTTTGSWSGSPTSYTYAWEDCNSSGNNCSGISGATQSSYTLSAGDVGDTVRVVVTAANAGGTGSQASAQTAVVIAPLLSAPTNTALPAISGVAQQGQTLTTTTGSWSGSPTGYTYAWEDCNSLGNNCSGISGATQSSYALSAGDVGDTVRVVVSAANAGGTTSQTSVQTAVVAASGNNTGFCNVSQAYTNLTTGPHLCGWPDSTNTGYENAPGYTGALTTAPTTACPAQSNLKSNTTYSFCKWTGLSMPANLTNVVFYGDDFDVTAPQNANVTGGSGDTGITFEYDTFQPNVSAPPVSCSQSYQYGIYNEGGQMKGYTVEYSDFWGFGNAIDTSGSTQAAPQVFKYNWIHDSSTTGGCGYHNDGIGMLNNGTEDYAVVDHNTIESIGNTNGIAWQNGTYAHDSDTNNLLSGWNEAFAGGRCTSSCTAPTYITVTGNVFSTYLSIEGDYPIDNATAYWSATGSTWNHNYWAVPPGAAWGTSAYNGYYWVPTTNSNYPSDCGFVSATDYPNATNPCK